MRATAGPRESREKSSPEEVSKSDACTRSAVLSVCETTRRVLLRARSAGEFSLVYWREKFFKVFGLKSFDEEFAPHYRRDLTN